MVNYCLALPILPGKGMELVKKFAQEHGGHTKEHDEFYRIAGISNTVSATSIAVLKDI
jgi:hypothetical protein